MEQGKDDCKKYLKMHLSGWDSDSESVMSEVCYEHLRPPPLTSEELLGRTVVVEAKSSIQDQQSFKSTLTSSDLNSSKKKSTVFQNVESMVKSEKCELCCIFIQSVKHAQDHIISKYHMNKLGFCLACYNNVNDTQSHLASEEHKYNKVTYCFICNIRAPTPIHLSQHKNASKHKNKTAELKVLETVKDSSNNIGYRSLTEKIIKLGSCFICPGWTNISSVERVATHLVSALHLELSRYCQICEENLPTKSAVDQHKTSERHKQNIKLNCLICDVKGSSECSMRQHVKGSLHRQNLRELNKMLPNEKQPALTEKPTPQTSSVMDTESRKWIGQNQCSLCNIKLNQNDIKSHCAGAKHRSKMMQFSNSVEEPKNLITSRPSTSSTLQNCLPPLSSISDFPPLPKPDLSYIEAASASNFLNFENDVSPPLPNVNLDTISPMDNQLHKQIMQTVESLDNPNTSYVNLDTISPMDNQLHKQFMQTVESLDNPNTGSKKGVLQDKLLTPNTSPVTKLTSERIIEIIEKPIPPDVKEDSSKSELEEMVLTQIKKLVNSLYFSKEVPLEKALEYLKKFNKIIEDHRLQAIQTNKETKENVNINLDQIDKEQQEKEIEVPIKKKRKSKKKKLTDLDSNSIAETITDSKETLGKTAIIENVKNDLEKAVSRNDYCDGQTFDNIEDKIENKNTSSLDESFQMENENLSTTTTTSVDKSTNEETPNNTEIKSENVIEDFINRKIPIFELADSNSPLEIEVLAELRTLVDSIYIDKEISIEQALLCLESFNGEVEKFIEKKNSTPKFPEFSMSYLDGW